MVISCGKCAKSFLLPDDKIKPTGTRVRCKQCGHEFVVMPPTAPPPAAEEPILLSDPDPLTVTPASGLQRSAPPASQGGDVASSYEITFQGLESGGPAPSGEEPPSSGGMSDADLVSALQSDPLLAAPEEAAPPAGGDVSIDFGVLDQVPEAPPPVSLSAGAEPPSPEMDALSMAEPEASASAQDVSSLQLDNLSLEEPPPEEHAPSLMAEPMRGGGSGGAESSSAGADPLAGLDLDFTLDEKAMGGGLSESHLSSPSPPPPPAPPTPEPSIFEPTSVESAPTPPPAAVTQESLKAEFESLGRDSLIKGNLDEIQAPEAPAYPSPPSPREQEPVRAAATPTSVAAKVAARAAEKEKKVAHLRRLELRSSGWLTAPLWLILLAGFGAAVWWFSPVPMPGMGEPPSRVTVESLIASRIGLRPVTEDVSPSIRRVRGRSYQNAYGESFYIVTGVVQKIQAETQTLRATFLDAQGWKMGEEPAYWVKEIPPREFALLSLVELRQALTNLAVGFQEAGADISFAIVYPTPLKIPDRTILEWTDAGPRSPTGGS
ncbi:MAG: zinc-ribbon domain-containing protein [Nitrospirae bacterium]|nr:zinc-ribbon domain-containing protein [Nitrospirota bacterium]